MIALSVTHDSITPVLQKLASQSGVVREAVLRAMVTTLKSITEGNFSAAGSAFRVAPWANKYDGSAATLRKSGTLWKSFHVAATAQEATLSNPTIYAAIHQQGGWRSAKEVTMPARPFVPVDANGQLSPSAAALLRRAGERALAGLFKG